MINEDTKQVIVTTSWDDGHNLDIKLAKLLKKYNVKGTFYVAVETSKYKEKDMLSKKEILDLSKYFEIGAHTINHPKLSQVDNMEAYHQISESKTYLEELLKKTIKMFCYPYGDYNEGTKEFVKRAGYIGARTVKQMFTRFPADPYEFNTTIQCRNMTSRFMWLNSIKNNIPLFPHILAGNWEENAKKIFDYVLKNGGIYHLWGHSWEVDRENNWEALERVLAYISNKTNVFYLTNGEVLEKINNRDKIYN